MKLDFFFSQESELRTEEGNIIPDGAACREAEACQLAIAFECLMFRGVL